MLASILRIRPGLAPKVAGRLALVGLAGAIPGGALAQTIAPAYAGTYSAHVLGSIAGLPTNYGGLVFKAGDPNTILIGGQANASAGRFHAVPVIRGAGQHITGFGTPVAQGFGAYNDGGVAYGPAGVLFCSRYSVNQVGQVRPGENAEGKVVDLGPLGVAASPGALGFVPQGFGGAGRMKVCSFSGGQFYDVAYAADGTGTYDLTGATQAVTLQGGPEGFIYAPPGSPLFPNPTLLVTEYNAGKVAAYDVDANGNPLTATRRDFVTGLTGGEGATIDPVTGDFLFSTFGASNRVIQIRGFVPPPPPATVVLASSANPSTFGQSVTFTASVTGVAPVTGTVTFKDGGSDLAGCANVALAGGAASCSTAALALGSHAVSAYYGGNATNAAGSGSLTQVVKKPSGLYVLNNGAIPYRPLLAPTVVAPNLEVTFLSAATISTAKVDVSANYQSGSDVLGILGQPGTSGTVDGLAWSWDAAAGVLTLTGAASEAVYQGALRKVTFYNGNAAAATAQRTVTFSLGSGLRFPGTGHFYEFVAADGILQSAARTAAAARTYFGLQGYLTTVTSQGETDFIIGKLGGKGGWIGASDAAVPDTWRWITGPEGLEDGGQGRHFSTGATSVGGNFVNWNPGEPNGSGDVAYFIKVGSSWGGVAGKWDDIPDNAGSAAGNIDGYVVEFGGMPTDPSLHLSDEAFVTMGSPIPNGILVRNASVVSFPSLGTPVVVAPNIEVAFSVPTPIDTAKADISANFQPGADRLGILGQTGTSGTVDGLSWSWDASSGVLTLTGSASEAVYQGALRKVTFVNTSPSPNTAQRTITFSLGSGLRYPGTGHFYEFVASAGILQSASIPAAAARRYFGLQGYLTTVTSQGETDFLVSKLGGRGAFIGASDALAEGSWRWVSGPEGLEDGGQGRLFYQNGAAVGGAFTNWNTGTGEPNGDGDVAFFIKTGVAWGGLVGRWADIPDTPSASAPNIDGYVTEYGGMPGDPALHLSDNAFVNVLVPVLSLTKTAGADPVPAGTNVTYTLAYANTGAAAAQGVVLTDVLPSGAAFVGATGGGTRSGGTVTWTLGTLAAGASGSVTLTVTAPAAAGTMTNSATIGATNAPAAPATRTVTVTGPTLTLRKSGPAGVATGRTITYTIQYGNTGTGTAASPVLVDTFPAGTTLSSATPAPTSQTATSATWNLADVAPPGSGSVSLTLNAPGAPGTITNSARLSATAATEVAATATSRVTTCANASLPCLTKGFLPGTIEAGTATSTLTLALENGTDGASRQVGFTDNLPAGLELAAAPASPQCGGTVTGAIGGSTIAVANATLGAGQQSCAITASVRGTTGGAKVNDATRFSGAASVDVSAANATVVVTQPKLALTKTASPATVLVGGTITWLLQYGNTGNSTATGAQLADALPAGATYVSSSPAGSLAGSTLTWSLGDLAAGASGSVSVVVRAPDAPTTLANTASLTATNATAANASASVRVYGEPAFALTVADGPDPVRAGTNLAYTLTVTNTGTIAATGTTLSLPIPGATTFVSATAGGTFSAGTVTWNLGSLDVGQATSVVATVNVNSPLANGTVLSTTGVANATNLPSPVSATAQTTVLSEPKLAVTLAAAPPLVQGGETVTWSLAFTNAGTDLAAGATLSFTAPASTSLVSLGGGSASGPVVTWDLGNVAVGQSGSVAVTVLADSGVPAGTVLTGSAALASSTTCGTPAAPCSATASASVVVATAPLLRLTKTAPPYVAAGGSITYELRYANDGNLDAQGVVLSDLLPVDTEFVSATSGGACSYGGAGPCLGFSDGTHRVTWTLGTVARGTEAVVLVTVRTRTPLAEGTPIVNTATLESTLVGGPQPASATATTRVTGSPVLTLTKTGKSPIAAGSQVTYTIAYENAGADQATGVVLTDQLPAGTSFVSATGGGTLAGGTVTWNLGTVAAGQGGSVNLTLAVGAAVPSGTVIVNSASVRSNETGDTTAQARTTVLSAPIPELRKSSTPAAVVDAGASVTWVLEFANSGNAEMTNAVLTDEVPLGLAPIFIGGGGTFDTASRRVTWNLGSVAPGASGSVTFGVIVPVGTPDGTALANTATFGADDALPVTAVHAITVTSAPVLELTKDAPAAAFPGDPITWTLHYRNTGNFTAYNAVLTDALPPETAFASAGGPYAVRGNVVTWSLGDLLPGAGGSVALSAVVGTPLPDGTLLANGATLEATNARGVSTVAATRVISAPLLRLTKVAPSQVAAGGQVLYQLTCRNDGTDAATGVVLTDTLPANVSYVSSTPSGTHASGVVTWNLGSIPAGGAVTVTLLANAASPLPNGTQLVNAANVRANENPPVGALASTTVTSSPLFLVAKSPASPVVAPNGTMTWTITYRNVGNEDSLNTRLVDLLPANAAYFAHTSNGGPGAYDPVARTVAWNLGTVAAGASGSEQVTVLVPAGTPNGTLVLNSATITGDDALPTSIQSPVVVAASPALRHVKAPAATVASPGQQVTFTLEYQNAGSGAATAATIVDAVPPFTSFVSATGGGTWDPGARTVTWSLGGLAAGSGGSVTLTLRLDTASPPVDGMILTNTSTFDTAETQPVAATSVVAVSAPVLLLSKSGAPDPVSAGSQIAWVLQYRNAGTGTATAVTISDTLEPNLSFLSLTGPGSYDAGTRTVTWTVPPLAPGASGSVTVLTRVATPLPNGTTLRNDASIDSLQTAAAAAAAIGTVQSAPALSLTKTAQPDPVSPGGVVTYTLTVLNGGNDDATSVVVVDRLPSGLQFLSATAGGVYDPAQHTVTWSLGTVPALSGPIALTATFRVDSPPGTVTNRAEISSAESPALAVSHDLRVELLVQVPGLSGPGLAALALALAFLGARLLRGAAA